jgi:hypothetical protein
VRQPRVPVSASYRAVDEMLDARISRRIREPHPLLDLPLVSRLPEILHRKRAIRSLERPIEGSSIIQIALDHFRSQLGQRPAVRGRCVSRKCPHCEPLP